MVAAKPDRSGVYGAALASTALLGVLVQGFSLWALALLATLLSALAAAALNLRYTSRSSFSPGLIATTIAALAAWFIVSAQLSAAGPAARLALTQPLLMPLAFAAFALAPGGVPAWRSMTLVGGMLCCGLAGIVLAEPLLFEHPTYSAFFVQRNSLSGYLLLASFSLVPQLTAGNSARRATMTPGWAASIFLGLFIVSFSTSRGAIVALIVGVGGLYLSLRRSEHAACGKFVVALALWAFLLADLSLKGGVFDSVASMREVSSELFLPGLSAIGAGDPGEVRKHALIKSYSLRDSKLASANERLLIWTATLEMLRAAPWHGYGTGTFRLVYPGFAWPEDRSAMTYAHNDYLQAAVELGVPGCVILLALGVVVTLRWRAHRRSARGTLEADALFWAMTATAAHSFFTYNFHVPATLILFGIVLARFDLLTRQGSEPGFIVPPLSRFLGRRMFLAVTTVLVLSVVTPPAAAAVMARYYERGIQALGEGRLEDAASALERAAWLSPNAQVAVAQAHVFITAYDASGEAGMLEVVAERLQAARRMDPYTAAVSYAELLLAMRRPDVTATARAALIADAYREAIRRDPRYFPVRLELARHLRQRGHAGPAREVLEDGLRYPVADHPLLLDYLEMLGELRRADGDEAGAREADREFRRLAQRLEASA